MIEPAWQCGCGHDNEADSRFCTNCGRPRPPEEAVATPGEAAPPVAPEPTEPAPDPEAPPAAAEPEAEPEPEPDAAAAAPAEPPAPLGQWPPPPPRREDLPPWWPTSIPVPSWFTPTPQNVGLIAFALAVLIVVVAVVALTGNQGPPNPNTVASPAPVDTAGAAQAVQSVVDQLSHYVERARGLTFVHPVKVALYDDAAFDARLKSLGSGRLDSSDVARIATYKALGMLPADFDPAKAGLDDTSSILGFYNPKTQELAIRGNSASIYVQRTIVHELTHALQDQRLGGLQTLIQAGDDDSALAARALVEGDAFRIQNAWVGSLSPEEQDLLEREARKNGDEQFPSEFLVGFQNFPYVLGEFFANKLIAAGGQAALDRAFAKPPVSTKQIIIPPAYLAGDNPVAVPAPAAGGAVIDHGTIGQFELIYVLAQAVGTQAAAFSSAGWAGSSFVTWQGTSGPCTRANFEAEGGAPGTALLDAGLRAWAAAAPGRSVQGTTVLTVTACV